MPESVRRWWPLGIAIVALVLMTWPWPSRPWTLPGSPAMEADNHLWMLWRSVQVALGRPGPWGNWPVGEDRPLMDLVHLPLAAATFPIDPAFGFGALLLVDVGVALLGGWLLSREAGADRLGAAVGMVALGAAPFLGGAIVFGLSEAWPLGWYAIHAALLLRVCRSAAPRRMALEAAGAAISLAAFALSGWYSAAFALLFEPLLVAWAWRRGLDRAGWVRIVVIGGVAVALVTPALVHFLAHGDWRIAWRPLPPYQPGADWRHGGPGNDPLTFFLPTTDRTELTRTTYLGLVAVALGVVGLAGTGEPPESEDDPRVAGDDRGRFVLLIGVLMAIVLAMGAHTTFAGVLLAPTAPAAWLHVVPGFAGIASWYRVGGMAIVFLAPLAALGATGIARGRLPVALLLVAAVLADDLGLSDAPWPRPVSDPRPPDELLAVPGRGPMLLLPFDRGEVRWPARVPRAYQRWQPWLRRPITEAYEAPDALLLSEPWIAWVNAQCSGGTVGQDAMFPTPPPPTAEPADGAGAIARADVDVVALVVPRASTPTRCEAAITRVLGPPAGKNDVVAWWKAR